MTFIVRVGGPSDFYCLDAGWNDKVCPARLRNVSVRMNGACLCLATSSELCSPWIGSNVVNASHLS